MISAATTMAGRLAPRAIPPSLVPTAAAGVVAAVLAARRRGAVGEQPLGVSSFLESTISVATRMRGSLAPGARRAVPAARCTLAWGAGVVRAEGQVQEGRRLGVVASFRV